MNRDTGHPSRWLCLAGGVAGLMAVFAIRRNLAAEASLSGWFGLLPAGFDPARADPSAWRAWFAEAPLPAFLAADGFDLVNITLLSLLFLPWLIRLAGSSRPAAIALGAAWIGVVVAFALASPALAYLAGLPRPPAVMTTTALGLFYGFGLAAVWLLRLLTSRWALAFGLAANLIGLSYVPLAIAGLPAAWAVIPAAAPFTVLWHGNLAFRLFRRPTVAQESN